MKTVSEKQQRKQKEIEKRNKRKSKQSNKYLFLDNKALIC